jgi:hypothetical protein
VSLRVSNLALFFLLFTLTHPALRPFSTIKPTTRDVRIGYFQPSL